MKKYLIILFFPLIIRGQAPADTISNQQMTLIFGGDLMCHSPQLNAAYNDSLNIYDFHENFTWVKNIFKQADYSIVNLETTIGNLPYKGYPQFSSPTELIKAAKDAGINVLVTANNHSCDRRKQGILSTLDYLDQFKILHTGTFRNAKEKASSSPLIIKKKGIKIALLNYTYGTNGIPVPYPVKVNLIDTIQIKKDLNTTKKLHPDLIIAFLHWGQQYQNKPSKKQIKLADFLHKKGVDWVIGSHPHVIQPIKITQNDTQKTQNISVFSLGNFISNQRTFPRDGSILMKVNIIKNKKGKLQIKSWETIPLWVYKYYEKKKNHYLILPVKDFIYQPNFFKQNKDYQKMMKFYKHYQTFNFK